MERGVEGERSPCAVLDLHCHGEVEARSVLALLCIQKAFWDGRAALAGRAPLFGVGRRV
ncbi:hypothetical protein WME98_38085 [Sorangium sp. So ce296]|uniref:hypothetical protein n=1 Tax=Sorangium sp. So ce296 TaxID=3133296 RepID=UPI003F62A11F